MSTERYDAIVVGSGLGGLSCAAYLAKNNLRVLVLEKNNVAGGYATSFRRGDFQFDSVLHMIDAVGSGQSMAKFFKLCGVADNVEFIELKYWMRLIFPKHDLNVPSGNLQEIIRMLECNFPREKEGINSFFKEICRIYKNAVDFFTQTAPMWQQLPAFPFRHKALFFAMKKTVNQLLEKHLKDEKLKAILFANYGYFGIPPSKANLVPIIANMSYWMEGSYYPKGGDQTLTDAFIKVIKQNNGRVLLGTEVTSIIVENERTVGIKTEKNENFFADNIISNINPEQTAYLLGKSKVLTKLLSKMKQMQPSISAFVVYLGLDESFKAKVNPNEYEITVSETYDLTEDYSNTMKHKFDKASFIITLYSNIDKTLAKNGKFVAALTQLHPYDYWEKFESHYQIGNKENYDKEKDLRAGSLIKRAEKVIPGLSKHIEVIEIATPLTLKRFTGNINGAIYGWANTTNQFTPMARILKYPVKNLYLSSAWGFPGEGHSGTVACGYRVAKQLINKSASQ